MFILPLRHDSLVARRWPFVTTVIVAVNIIVFAITIVPMLQTEGAYQEKRTEAIEYLGDRPYLKVPPALAVELGDDLDRVREAADDVEPPVLSAERSREALELQQLTDAVVEARSTSTLGRYAYTPARGGVGNLVSYAFLHGGVLHLVFNLWFLWLVGCNIEDRWGRLAFPLFYVSAAVVSAISHRIAFPDSTIPLIGASGAVAGAMGAFLVRFATTQIRFGYWIFFRWGTFWAPAYVMLPLWALSELFWALASEDVAGVAYWTHVGGFIFGVVFAATMVLTGLERSIDEQIEMQGGVSQDPRLIEAGRLVDDGRATDALVTLGALAGEKPDSIDVQLELLRAATAASDGMRQLRAYGRLITLYLDQGLADTAVELYVEVEQLGWAGRLPERLRLRVEAAKASLPPKPPVASAPPPTSGGPPRAT